MLHGMVGFLVDVVCCRFQIGVYKNLKVRELHGDRVDVIYSLFDLKKSLLFFIFLRKLQCLRLLYCSRQTVKLQLLQRTSLSESFCCSPARPKPLHSIKVLETCLQVVFIRGHAPEMCKYLYDFLKKNDIIWWVSVQRIYKHNGAPRKEKLCVCVCVGN